MTSVAHATSLSLKWPRDLSNLHPEKVRSCTSPPPPPPAAYYGRRRENKQVQPPGLSLAYQLGVCFLHRRTRMKCPTRPATHSSLFCHFASSYSTSQIAYLAGFKLESSGGLSLSNTSCHDSNAYASAFSFRQIRVKSSLRQIHHWQRPKAGDCLEASQQPSRSLVAPFGRGQN